MKNNKNVLLVDDDRKALFLLSDALEEQGYTVKSTTYPSEALKLIQQEPMDAVVLDLVMPEIDGIETLRKIKEFDPHLPVIMLSGHGNIEKAVQAVKLGAYDFLEKPVRTDKIGVVLKNAIANASLVKDKQRLLETVREKYRMTGSSKAMQDIHKLICRIAPEDSPVLITGENGTGKELIARALHFKSPRGAKPFVAINCAAIPGNLLESELFGHEKGAFTDAKEAKPGLFEQAHHGTLFLDEISELDIRLQPKLLRVLESMEIQRVGAVATRNVDVRIITATNKDLGQAIEEKTFRDDLFYRISVLNVDVPPLRERKEDIPELAGHFARLFCHRRKTPVITFHPRAIEVLLTYPWPGNIRQLKNLVEKIVVLSDEAEIPPETVQRYLSGEKKDLHTDETLEQTRNRAEKEKLLARLHALAWDYEATAQELGISRATLFNKLKAHNISGKRSR